MKNNTIIIGGGASALMLAAQLPKGSATLIEHNAKLGTKILVSGGGKCNITNKKMGSGFFLAKDEFVLSALQRFSQVDLIRWLHKKGLKTVLRNQTQYFCERSAKDIVDLLAREAKRQKIQLNESVTEVSKRGTYFTVKTDKRTYSARHVVVASGGLSFPRLGASSIGYEIASHFGHTIIDTAPALVGFTVQKEQFFFKELSGASTDVVINIEGNICEGSLLFAHRGISGPAVLNASLYWKRGKVEIDFMPGFLLDGIKSSRKQLSSLLPMPKRITKAFLIQLGLDDKPGNQLNSEEVKLLELLRRYSFSPAGTFGYAKAEVTRGGVCTDEIDSDTLMSRLVEGLYFTGEVLDVTGRLGGYNFQWAFSSAHECAKAIREKE